MAGCELVIAVEEMYGHSLNVQQPLLLQSFWGLS
jgi:hypothetical protein